MANRTIEHNLLFSSRIKLELEEIYKVETVRHDRTIFCYALMHKDSYDFLRLHISEPHNKCYLTTSSDVPSVIWTTCDLSIAEFVRDKRVYPERFNPLDRPVHIYDPKDIEIVELFMSIQVVPVRKRSYER